MNLEFLENIQVALRDFEILDELGVFGEYPSSLEGLWNFG